MAPRADTDRRFSRATQVRRCLDFFAACAAIGLCVGGIVLGCRHDVREPGSEAKRLRLVRPAVPLTDGSLPLKYPRWSEGGGRIAAAGFDDNSLWVLNADGTGLRKVAEGVGIGPAYCWCGDRVLVYRTARYLGRRRAWQVVALDVATGSRRILFEGTGRVSLPYSVGDGRTAAVQIGDSLRLFRVVAAGETSTMEKLTPRDWARAADRGFVILLHGPRAYLWLAGKTLPRTVNLPAGGQALNVVYHPPTGWLAYELLGSDSVFVQDGSSGKRLAVRGHRPAWSPRGPFLACELERSDGLRILGTDIVVYDLACDSTIVVTQTPGMLERAPDWAPDGKRLTYYDERTGTLYIAEFDYERAGERSRSR